MGMITVSEDQFKKVLSDVERLISDVSELIG